MNDENNVFEGNSSPGQPGNQSPYGPQVNNGDGPVSLDKNQQPQNGEQARQSYEGRQPYEGQPQQSEHQQLPNGGQSQPPGYVQPPYGGQNQYTQTSGYAEPIFQQESQSTVSAESGGFGIASMICGILALITCCLWCTCIPLAIVSIVLGILQIGKGTAKGMAVAGIVCSAIALILLLILTIVGVFVQNSPAYYDIMRELQYMNYRHHM
ncbi:hypothetical protein D3Z36_04150 [Lachnospiraceae bacterium]|nr:hypothetical protein [Lachnospiraceae bacterium]